jgi:hypothetical protein
MSCGSASGVAAGQPALRQAKIRRIAEVNDVFACHLTRCAATGPPDDVGR